MKGQAAEGPVPTALRTPMDRGSLASLGAISDL